MSAMIPTIRVPAAQDFVVVVAIFALPGVLAIEHVPKTSHPSILETVLTPTGPNIYYFVKLFIDYSILKTSK